MFKKNKTYLSDHVPMLFFDGNVGINNKGSLQTSVMCQPKDHSFSTDDEIRNEAARFNNVIKRLGNGWAIFFEVRRLEDTDSLNKIHSKYPGQLIDEERRQLFQNNIYFQSSFIITFVYSPPQNKNSKIPGIFFTRNKANQDVFTKHKSYFKKHIDKISDLLEEIYLSVCQLDRDETISYLHSCVSTKCHKISLSKEIIIPDFTDQPLSGGMYPKIGNHHLRVISIKSFGGVQETFPEILSQLNKLGFCYRWVSRFICLGQEESLKELKSRSRAWSTKSRDFSAIIKSAFFREAIFNEKIDSYSAKRSIECDEMTEAVNEGVVSLGYLTITISIWDKEPETVEDNRRKVEAILNSRGFVSVKETFNSIEAFFSSLPGDTFSNVRRSLITTINLPHFIPLSSRWEGQKWNQHLNEEPLLFGKTHENEIFRYCPYVADVGNVLIFGPTGEGKSVFLSLNAIQYLKYKGAKVYYFDKDFSGFCSTVLMGGNHLDLGRNKDLCFQPLMNIDDESQRQWALNFVSDIIRQENVDITGEIKSELWGALSNMESMPPGQRTLSGLMSLVQDHQIRAALQNSINSGLGILNADNDALNLSDWTTFELSYLIEYNPKAVGPVLLYLFHQLDSQFNGDPTVIILDEAWLFLSNPLFAGKIKDWLKSLRKKNVSVWMATQSIGDILKSPIAETIKQSFPTRIYLPNSNVQDTSIKQQYMDFGLNEKEIQIIGEAAPKKDYYFKSELGNRLIDLGIEKGSATLAICGSSSKADIKKMTELQKEYPTNEPLVRAFLKYKNVKTS
jgi:type IV secretion system protein TrbE